MKRNMRVLALTLAVSLTAAICSGCGAPAGENNSSEISSSVENQSATGEKVTVEFYQQKAEIAEVMAKIIEAFEKDNPDIHIEQINLPESEKDTVLQSRVASGDVPAVLSCWWNNSAWMIYEEGACRDLGELTLMDNVKDSIRETTKYKNGENYFLPLSMNCEGVFYNKEIFAEHNIEIPKTQDEFWAVCEELKAAGVQPIMVTDKEGWTVGHVLCDFIGLTLPNYLEDFKKLYAGEMKAQDVEGIDELAELFLKVREYTQEDTLGTGYDQGVSDFANGGAAMLIQGIWMIPVLESNNPDLDYAMFPFPGKTEADTRILAGTDVGLSMAQDQKSPEIEAAALKFLEYFASGDGAQLFADLDGSPSAIKNVTAGNDRYTLLTEMIDADRSFWWPSETSWGDGTYDEVVITFQNLLMSRDMNQFYADFENAFLNTSEPVYYFYKGQTIKE